MVRYALASLWFFALIACGGTDSSSRRPANVASPGDPVYEDLMAFYDACDKLDDPYNDESIEAAADDLAKKYEFDEEAFQKLADTHHAIHTQHKPECSSHMSVALSAASERQQERILKQMEQQNAQ